MSISESSAILVGAMVGMSARGALRPTPLLVTKSNSSELRQSARASTVDVLPPLRETACYNESDDEGSGSFLSRSSSEGDLSAEQGYAHAHPPQTEQERRSVTFSGDLVEIKTIELHASGYEKKNLAIAVAPSLKKERKPANLPPIRAASPSSREVGAGIGEPELKVENKCSSEESSMKRAELLAKKYGVHNQWTQGIKGRAQTMPDLPTLNM